MIKWEPRTIDIISIFYTVGYFALFILAFFREFPQTNEKVLTVLLGLLSAAQLRIVDSFFTKDASNSATSTTIRALKADADSPAVLDAGVVVPAVPATKP
jgi:hypothetical protein